MPPPNSSQDANDAAAETVLTSSTHRQDNADDAVIEKIFSYLREENIKGKNRTPLPSTADEMSRFIPKFCIGFFNYCNWKNEFQIEKSIHQIFACSINEQVCILHIMPTSHNLTLNLSKGGPRGTVIQEFHREDGRHSQQDRGAKRQ